MVEIDSGKCLEGVETEVETSDDESFNEDPPSSPNHLVIDLDRCTEAEISNKGFALHSEDSNDGCYTDKDITSSELTMHAESDDEGVYSLETDAASSQLSVVNPSDNADLSSPPPLNEDNHEDDFLYDEDLDCGPETPVVDIKENFYDTLLNIKEDTKTEFDDQSELYDDLLSKEHFERKERAKNLQENYELMLVQNKALTEHVQKLSAELLNLQKKNSTLIINISSLYQTARLEIERKDNEIDTLRRDLDGLLFRRNVSPNSRFIRNKRSHVLSGQTKMKDVAGKPYVHDKESAKYKSHYDKNVQVNKSAYKTAESDCSPKERETNKAIDPDFLRLKNYLSASKSKFPKSNKSVPPSKNSKVLNCNVKNVGSSSDGQVEREPLGSDHTTTRSSCTPALTSDNSVKESSITADKDSLQESVSNSINIQPIINDSEPAIVIKAELQEETANSKNVKDAIRNCEQAVSTKADLKEQLIRTPKRTPQKKSIEPMPRKSPRNKKITSETGSTVDQTKPKCTSKDSPSFRTSPRKKACGVLKFQDVDDQHELLKSENEASPLSKKLEAESSAPKRTTKDRHTPTIRTSPRKKADGVHITRDTNVQRSLFKHERESSPHKKVLDKIVTPKKSVPSSSVVREKNLKFEDLAVPQKKNHEVNCRTSPRKRNSSLPTEESMARRVTPRKKVDTSKMRDENLKCEKISPDDKGFSHKRTQRSNFRTTPRKQKSSSSNVQDSDVQSGSLRSKRETDLPKTTHRELSRMSPRKRTTNHSHYSHHGGDAHRRLLERDTSPHRKRARYSSEKDERKPKPTLENSTNLSNKNGKEAIHNSSRLKLLMKYKKQGVYKKDDYYRSGKMSIMRSSSVVRSVSVSRKKDTKLKFDNADHKYFPLKKNSRDHVHKEDRNKQRNVCKRKSSPLKDMSHKEHTKHPRDEMCPSDKLPNCFKRSSHSLEKKTNNILTKDLNFKKAELEKLSPKQGDTNKTLLKDSSCDFQSKSCLSVTKVQQICSSPKNNDALEDGEILSD